jgi:hypothetical protein
MINVSELKKFLALFFFGSAIIGFGVSELASGLNSFVLPLWASLLLILSGLCFVIGCFKKYVYALAKGFDEN